MINHNCSNNLYMNPPRCECHACTQARAAERGQLTVNGQPWPTGFPDRQYQGPISVPSQPTTGG